MIPLRLYLVGGLLAIMLGFVGWHLYGDHRVQAKLAATELQLNTALDQQKALQDQLVAVTADKEAFDKARQEADTARLKVQTDLATTLNKLKAVPAPKTCPAQLDWLYENAR